MLLKEYLPTNDVKTEEMRSPEGNKSSIFTFDGPPFFSEQLSPPTAPTTLPDMVNLQIFMVVFFFFLDWYKYDMEDNTSYLKETKVNYLFDT